MYQPVDNSPLVLFRMFFGLLLFLETAGAIATGWVKENFIEPFVHFPFIYFDWLSPLPGYGMYFYYGLMALLGLMVMIGMYYRFSIGAFTLLWWASYLMQKTSYNNHYYLLILLCFLMFLVPAHRYASWDVRQNLAVKSLTCPRWCLVVFATQIGMVYTFAAIAKMYPDWLAAVPISIWFKAKVNYVLIGPLLQEQWLQIMVAYGGIAFDLLITPLLLFRKTRKPAFILSIFFHLFNSVVFGVGVFPYVAIALSVFFFPPETIRALFFRKKPLLYSETSLPEKVPAKWPVVLYLLAFYFLIQLWLPLRHWFIPGNVHWTEEGHRMAWQMMLRTKSGSVYYRVKDPITNKTQNVYPAAFLTSKQERVLANRPDMIWQFAQFLEKHFRQQGYRQVQVYAFTAVSLNGRSRQALVDSTVDLAAVPWQPFQHAGWILPLQE